MSKNKQPMGAAMAVLNADEALRAAANLFGEEETDETLERLRDAALVFADAVRACEPGKGRP